LHCWIIAIAAISCESLAVLPLHQYTRHQRRDEMSLQEGGEVA